ncbi:MAG TPA: LysM peptidoglycan-binding domain-containing protein [Moheibacter sp.]|nr:LysM peptidoglycan-binding domain-containing protein [Moheibacter sp.]
MRKIIGLLLFLMLSNVVWAQQKTHTVAAQETVYGIARQYGISQEDLKKANAFLSERGLQIGDVLTIPSEGIPLKNNNGDGNIKAVVTTTEKPAVFIPEEDENYFYIEIPAKQTIYTLTKTYNISEKALVSLNPQLSQGLKAGDIIRIPKKKNEQEIAPEGMYKVVAGDTVYTLSQQFGVGQDEFYIANPEVQKNGLNVDAYVHIPKKGKTSAVVQDGVILHKVKSGETIYSILKMYKISFAQLLQDNPALSEGLQAGMVLKIILSDDVRIVNFDQIRRVKDNEINLGLLLPFHLEDLNKTAKEREISTDILIGAKVALDSLARKGKKVNLTVMDSGNETDKIEKALAQENFSKFDAVIGPLFASNFKHLAGILSNSGIPLVAPLSNAADLVEYNNVLIATPADEAIALAVIEKMVAEYKGQPIQVLTDERHDALAQFVVDQLKVQLPKAEISLTKDVRKLVQKTESGLEKLSDGTQVEKVYVHPNVTVLVSDNNALGQAYVDQLKAMDAENLQAYGVKYVSAYDNYNDKNKANIAVLKNIGFTYGTVRLVNVFGEKERATLENFMDVYCVMPNEYQQVGFDIVYDLVDRMNAGGDVLNALSQEQTRLSTKFKYEKVGKAFVNKAVRTIRLFVPHDESPDEVEETNH